MTASVTTPPSAAPPRDPVLAALEDPDTNAMLVRQARAILSRRGGVASVHIDDVLQKTRERAIVCGRKYDGGRPVIAWLYGILRHVIQEDVRAARRWPAQLPADPALWEGAAALADPEAEAAGQRRLVDECLSHLSEIDQKILRLSFYDDLSLPDIAAQVGIGYAAARMRFSRAMRRLRARAAARPTEDRS